MKRAGSAQHGKCMRKRACRSSQFSHQRLTYPIGIMANRSCRKFVQWQAKVEHEPNPILVVTYCRENEMLLSLMYLAHAEGFPAPSSEVKGLLLLTQEEIHRLCQESLTLEQYLIQGGKAILNAAFDRSLLLEPFAQLRLLSRILSIQSKAKVT